MFIIRSLLGCIILGFNFIFSPRSPKRDADTQQAINDKTQHLSLYQLPACPFCVKVRRAMKREGLQINILNTKDDVYRTELVNGGGRHKVPCLKIAKPNEPVEWLYESNDIIVYLKQFT